MSDALIFSGKLTPEILREKFQDVVVAGSTPPTYENIEIVVGENGDEPSAIYGQRGTKAATILKNLAAEGGFNWNLWRPISVARWVDPKTGKLVTKRWDGDHRYHMWRIVFPNATTFPAIVYSVKNEAEANMLFVKVQSSRQKSLSVEEIFVNEVLAHDEHANYVASEMERLGVCVKLDDADNPADATTIPQNSPATAWTTKVRRFKDSLKLSIPTNRDNVPVAITAQGSPSTGPEFTEAAVNTIKKIWPLGDVKHAKRPGTKPNLYLRPEALFGLARLYSFFPILAVGSAKIEFENFLQVMAMSKDFKEFFGEAKAAGGNAHNAEGESIALGIIEAFKKSSAISESLHKKLVVKHLKDVIARA